MKNDGRGIPEEEMEWLLDLRPFANMSPVVVNGNASATQVQHTFRSLGCHEVRHSIALTPQPMPVAAQPFGSTLSSREGLNAIITAILSHAHCSLGATRYVI